MVIGADQRRTSGSAWATAMPAPLSSGKPCGGVVHASHTLPAESSAAGESCMPTTDPLLESSTASDVDQEPAAASADVATQMRFAGTSVKGVGGCTPHPPSGPCRVPQIA